MGGDTLVERHWRQHACEKEPWTAAWLDTLGPDDRLVNVGANVGSYALIAVYRGADVLAVEAHPTNAARLAENVAANRLGQRVTLVLGVCGPTVMPRGTWVKHFDPGVADIQIVEPHPKGVILPGVTLDELAEVYGQPTHMLIDVDGGEVDVLRGGAEALAGVRDVMIEISTDPAISKGCTALLEVAGLVMVERWDTRDGVSIPDVWYGLFRRAPT